MPRLNKKILVGDVRTEIKKIPDASVHCVVTSPPYWGLRSYLPKDHKNKHREIGSEPTPEKYVETMVDVFREIKRVLHDSGTVGQIASVLRRNWILIELNEEYAKLAEERVKLVNHGLFFSTKAKANRPRIVAKQKTGLFNEGLR